MSGFKRGKRAQAANSGYLAGSGYASHNVRVCTANSRAVMVVISIVTQSDWEYESL